MRIAIDCRTAHGNAGIAQYGKNLCATLPVVAPNDELFFIGQKEGGIPLWTSHFSFAANVRHAKPGLLHVLGGVAPLGYRRPFVLTVHDLAIYRHAEWFPDGQWLSTHLFFPDSIRRAVRIIAPSVATKNELMDLFKVQEEKIVVIPHGVCPIPTTHNLQPNIRYILFVGTIEPRKNITTLIRAYRSLVDSCPDLRDVELRIIGAVGWKAEAIEDEIRKTQCEGYGVKLLGAVSEEEKWRHISGAACVAYPSFYEGFGLPVLEGMAAGVPVLCSDIPVLAEISSGVALLAPPDDVAAWSANLTVVLKDKKTAVRLKETGLTRAAEYSWEKTAAATIEVYRASVE